MKSICADTKKNNNALRHTITSYQSKFQLYTAEYANQLQLAKQVHTVLQKQFTMMMHQIEQEKQCVLCKLKDRQACDIQHHQAELDERFNRVVAEIRRKCEYESTAKLQAVISEYQKHSHEKLEAMASRLHDKFQQKADKARQREVSNVFRDVEAS